jgi:diguanylate cyclase
MSIYDDILKNINQPSHAHLFTAIFDVVAPHSEQIAKNFYRQMLANNQAANFLNHDDVKKRLISSMEVWIKSLFVYREHYQELEDYKASQLKIGHIHCKIGLPVSLVNYGMFVLKQDVLNLLIHATFNKQDCGAIMILSNQILDVALQMINESYEQDLIVSEKDSQAFKIQFSTHHLAFDCERLRTSLSDWMRDLLLSIQHESFDRHRLLSVRQSNFGLWLTHKAKLFLSSRQEFTTLIGLLNDMDETMHLLLECLADDAQRQTHLGDLNSLVNQASWILGQIAKDIIDQDNGRDTLTRLFSRRYLDTVMRHETESSLKTGVVFGVLVIDIDYFKKVNDAYGHDNGDRVLAQFAEILTYEVRAGDFVFRLGGEEFLIILGDVNERVTKSVAEKIRLTIANTEFHLSEDRKLTLTVSMGTAMHDGHPDFQRTIKLADDALYQAKQQGRNRVVAAIQPPVTCSLA